MEGGYVFLPTVIGDVVIGMSPGGRDRSRLYKETAIGHGETRMTTVPGPLNGTERRRLRLARHCRISGLARSCYNGRKCTAG